MTGCDLLETVIVTSGVSVRKLAGEIDRDPRLVRRWRSGATPIPAAGIVQLKGYLKRLRQSSGPRAAARGRRKTG